MDSENASSPDANGAETSVLTTVFITVTANTMTAKKAMTNERNGVCMNNKEFEMMNQKLFNEAMEKLELNTVAGYSEAISILDIYYLEVLLHKELNI